MKSITMPSMIVFAGVVSAWCGSGVVVDSLGVPLENVEIVRSSDGKVVRSGADGRWGFPASSGVELTASAPRGSGRLMPHGARLEYQPAPGVALNGRRMGFVDKETGRSAINHAARETAAADSVRASAKGWSNGSAGYDPASDSNRIVLRLAGSRGMVPIPGGWDSLGRKNLVNNLPHVARVAGFWMDTVEVTQALYDSLMGKNPSFHANCRTCPVERVSWYDAVRFCNARSRAEGLPEAYDLSSADSLKWGWNPRSSGFRLPTDTEWEYAARAGTSAEWYWGSMIGPTTVIKYAWHNLNSGDSTNPVGRLLPNAFRLYDIAGNVTEWTWDWSVDYDGDTLQFHKGPSEIGLNRATRGGDFSSLGTDVSHSRRIPALPTSRWLALGFRCARGVMP